MRQLLTDRLTLNEYRRHPENGAVYNRHSFLEDYPFYVVAEAVVSDSVVYVRAFPVRPDVPRADTLVTYFRHGPQHRRVPCVADQLDTTQQVTIRFSYRLLPPGPGRPGR